MVTETLRRKYVDSRRLRKNVSCTHFRMICWLFASDGHNNGTRRSCAFTTDMFIIFVRMLNRNHTIFIYSSKWIGRFQKWIRRNRSTIMHGTWTVTCYRDNSGEWIGHRYRWVGGRGWRRKWLQWGDAARPPTVFFSKSIILQGQKHESKEWFN